MKKDYLDMATIIFGWAAQEDWCQTEKFDTVSESQLRLGKGRKNPIGSGS